MLCSYTLTSTSRTDVFSFLIYHLNLTKASRLLAKVDKGHCVLAIQAVQQPALACLQLASSSETQTQSVTIPQSKLNSIQSGRMVIKHLPTCVNHVNISIQCRTDGWVSISLITIWYTLCKAKHCKKYFYKINGILQ